MKDIDFGNLMKIAQEMSKKNASPTPYVLSDIDKVVNNQQLRILKATLPYLDVYHQSKFAIILKIMELKKTMELYNSKNALQENIIPRKQMKHIDILTDIRNVSDEPQQKTLNAFIMLMNFKNLIQNINNNQLTTEQNNEYNNKELFPLSNNTYNNSTYNNNSNNEDTYNNFLNMVNKIINEKDGK